MTIVAFFDIAFLATLPGRTIGPAVMDRHGTVRSGPLTLYSRNPFGRSLCVQPREDKRKPFTVGLVCVRIGPTEATLALCDRLSNPLIEVDAVYHVLWPGKPTTNTVWTAVEDYTWFEAFSEEGRGLHASVAYAG